MKSSFSLTFIKVLFFTLFVTTANSQIYYSENGNTEEVKTFYLGFENNVSFTTFSDVSELSSPNAKIISKAGTPSTFVVIPNSRDSVVLYLKTRSTDDKGKEVVKDIVLKYPVEPLPRTSLCLGISQNDGKIDLNNLTLQYCYPTGTPTIFQVTESPVNWVVSIQGSKKSLSGTGQLLSAEAMRHIKKANINKKITISTVSSGKKVINGVFVR